jgi:hypothetical protein
MIERRDADERARIIGKIVTVLRVGDVVSLHDLAHAAGDIPEHVAARIVKRFALRGLVRNVSQGSWSGTAAMRVEPLLTQCPAMP